MVNAARPYAQRNIWSVVMAQTKQFRLLDPLCYDQWWVIGGEDVIRLSYRYPLLQHFLLLPFSFLIY